MIIEEKNEEEESQDKDPSPINKKSPDEEPQVKFEKVQLQIFGPQSPSIQSPTKLLEIEDQFYIKLKMRHAIENNSSESSKSDLS